MATEDQELDSRRDNQGLGINKDSDEAARTCFCGYFIEVSMGGVQVSLLGVCLTGFTKFISGVLVILISRYSCNFLSGLTFLNN